MRNIITNLSKPFQLAEDVPLAANRDHLANERTFHAWLRLSMGLSVTGVVIAQMSQIQRAVHPGPRKHEFKFYVLGVPQAAVCQLLAISIVVVAAFRFFKQERAIKNRKAHVGGWELLMAGGMVLLLLVVFFCFLFFVDVIEVFG